MNNENTHKNKKVTNSNKQNDRKYPTTNNKL